MADAAKVAMAPWRFLYPMVAMIMLLLAVLIIALQVGSSALFYAFWCAWALGIVTLMALSSSSAPGARHVAEKGSDKVTCPHVRESESNLNSDEELKPPAVHTEV